MNRRFGRQPDPARFYKPRPGVYAIVIATGGVLVTFQQDPEPEFQLRGGGIDPGESTLPALHREVMEETGYRIHGPRRLGMFHSFKYMPDYDLWAQKQCHVYVARAGRRIGPPTETGHWPVILPWDEAAARVAALGDRHFLDLAASLRLD
jgi:8-oxo-dGTP diphosphatase